MALTKEERDRADKVKGNVESLLEDAEFTQAATAAVGLFGGLLGAAVSYALDTNGGAAIRGSVKQARALYTEWSTVHRAWLDVGHDNNSDDYKLPRWIQEGDDLAHMLKGDGWEGIYDASLFAAPVHVLTHPIENVQVAAEEAGKLLAPILKPLTDPFKLSTKLLIGGVVGVVVLGVAGYALNSAGGLVKAVEGRS